MPMDRLNKQWQLACCGLALAAGIAGCRSLRSEHIPPERPNTHEAQAGEDHRVGFGQDPHPQISTGFPVGAPGTQGSQAAYGSAPTFSSAPASAASPAPGGGALLAPAGDTNASTGAAPAVQPATNPQ
jgi:hypothetical protein